MFLYILLTLTIVIYSGADQEHFYVYNTENGHLTNKFDCIYHGVDNIPFCRRFADGERVINLITENRCYNGGQRWNFSTLITLGIEPDNVLKWSSSIEKVDDYAAFYHYYNHITKNITSDSFLCDCSIRKGVFGKFCTYILMYDAHSVNEALDNQFSNRDSFWFFHQAMGSILCYVTLICDSGSLCLEWRDICDGHQNCMDGWDEMNCNILEFYECDENEYRCSNGMCIPDAYFLDGKLEIPRKKGG
jgi:hypothetical protein